MAIEPYYEKLILLYDKLRIANENLLINNKGQEAFEELVEYRFEYFDEISRIRDDLVDELSELKLDFSYETMDLASILKELPNYYPNLLQYRNKLIEALKKLVDSENNVSENMTDLKEDIRKELSQARTSKKTLNAYKPATGYSGSHFIDSKK